MTFGNKLHYASYKESMTAKKSTRRKDLPKKEPASKKQTEKPTAKEEKVKEAIQEAVADQRQEIASALFTADTSKNMEISVSEDVKIKVDQNSKQNNKATEAVEESKNSESSDKKQGDPTSTSEQQESEKSQKEDKSEEKSDTKKDDFFDGFKDDDEDKKSITRVILWSILIILFVALLVLTGLIVYQEGVKKGQEFAKEQSQSTTPAQVDPTPTVSEVSKSDYTIKVLNGSGVGGQAAQVKTLLEEKGYSVSSIGNADENVEKTIIKKKNSVDSKIVNMLREDLGETYSLDETQDLDDSEDEDIAVIIGSEKTESE